MVRQKTYGKFKQRDFIQVPFNYPLVSYNRTRLTIIRESNPQFKLPKWKNTVRLQQLVGKRLL